VIAAQGGAYVEQGTVGATSAEDLSARVAIIAFVVAPSPSCRPAVVASDDRSKRPDRNADLVTRIEVEALT
jgi:hypothetical protein